MDTHEELIERLAERRRKALGGLSESGFQELLLAVDKDPAGFIATPEDEAFAMLCAALDSYEADRTNDDLLDDDEYMKARAARLERLSRACEQVLAVDSACGDARLCKAIAAEKGPDALLDDLLEIEADEADAALELLSDGCSDLWSSVWLHPLMRTRATIARTCLDSARFRPCINWCRDLLKRSPSDPLGVRHTLALAYARLEDENALDQLDAHFGRHGSAWSHLAQTLLLFRLDRMGAARRALEGYASLCTGGSYALLRPALVDLYLPDRPKTEPGSIDEAVFVVHEADPIIVDTPDFIAWAENVKGFTVSAEAFADKHDLDW